MTHPPKSDKERLYKKLFEENSLLREMNAKKRQQMEQLMSKIDNLTKEIKLADDTTKRDGNGLIKLKSAIEQAQSTNVTKFNYRMP